MIQYTGICLDMQYSLHRYFKQKANLKMILLLGFFIIVPGIIWILVMFYGSDATGKPYNLRLSANDLTVVAFQEIEGNSRNTKSPILIAMICFHVIQFLGTVIIYVKILYVGYSSTTRVATRRLPSIRDPNEASRSTDNGGRNPENANFELQTVKCTDEKSLKPPKTIFLKERKKELKLVNDYNNRKCFKSNQINPISSKYSSVDSAEGLKQSGNTNNETDIKDNARKFQVSDQGIPSKIRSHKSPDIKGTKTYLQPKSGDHVVNIPLSNITFCVSRQDIICTIGLSCQVTSLILAFILCTFGFTISGKVVTLHDFFPAYYCLEAGLIINSLVDPIICVAFSNNFRIALKDIILCRKK